MDIAIRVWARLGVLAVPVLIYVGWHEAVWHAMRGSETDDFAYWWSFYMAVPLTALTLMGAFGVLSALHWAITGRQIWRGTK